MMKTERTIHYDDLPDIETEVLIELPLGELEAYLLEAQCTINNAQMTHDRLRAVRMEKIRRACAGRRGGVDEPC